MTTHSTKVPVAKSLAWPLLLAACAGPLQRPPPARRSLAGARGLRLILMGASRRLMDGPVFRLGAVSEADFGWGRASVSARPRSASATESSDDGGFDFEADAEEAPADEGLSLDRPRDINDLIGADYQRYRRIRGLTLAEERRYVALAQAGDPYSSHKLIVHHMPLLMAAAKRYGGKGLAQSELVNEGVFGIMRSLGRFDRTRRVRFGTYAKWWIRDAMEQALTNQSRLIRLPSHVVRSQGRARRDGVAVAHLVEQPDAPADRNVRFDGACAAVSVELDVGADASAPESDPERLTMKRQARTALAQALSRLPPRLRQVVVRRFGLDHREPATLQVVGEELGMSHERVRQLQQEAVACLRSTLSGCECLLDEEE